MADTLTIFGSSETKVRLREPFISEGLNAKTAVALPPGLYRGFRLAATGSASPRTVQIVADTTNTDHVAVYQTASGYSLTIRKVSGNFTVNLSSATFDNTTVVICIYATYVLGVPTTASLKAYTLTEYNAATEKSELLVLGTIAVGAAGVAIPAADIGYDRRTEAWEKAAPQTVPFSPIIKNSSFDWARNSGSFRHSALYWEKEYTVGSSTWVTDISVPNTGPRGVVFIYGGVASSSRLYQKLNVPTYAGQLIKYRFSKRAVQALTGGTFEFFIGFKDTAGAALSTSTVAIPLAGADGAFSVIEGFFTAPASSQLIFEAGIRTSNATFALSSAAARIDDLQIWVERGSNLNPDARQDGSGEVVALPLILMDHDAFPGFASYSGVVVEFISTAPSGEGTVSITPLVPGSNGPLLETGGRLHLGSSRLADEASALLPRIQAEYGVAAGIDYTLMWQSGPVSGSTPVVRMWATPTGGWLFTSNAVWGAPTANSWNKDVSGTQATKFEMTSPGVIKYQQRLAANNAAWLDSAWDSLPIQVDGTGDPRVTAELLTLGNSFLANSTDSLKSRITMQNSAAHLRTLLMEFGSGSGVSRVRLYAVGTVAGIGLEIVNNARWDGTNWNKDDSGSGCARLRILDGDLHHDCVTQAAATPFADGLFRNVWSTFHFSTHPVIKSNGAAFTMTPVTAGDLNPSATAAIDANTLYAKNIIKAWGTLDLDGAGNLTILDGFNIDSVDLITDVIIVTYTVSMGNTNYSYYAWMGSPEPGHVITENNNTAAGTLSFLFMDSTGNQVDLDVRDSRVFFMVVGQQGI